MQKKVAVRLLCAAAVVCVLLSACGCSVSQMSSLRELSRSYVGVYECRALYAGGADLSAGATFTLTLEYDGRAVFSLRRGGERRTFVCRYRAEPETGRIAFGTDDGPFRTYVMENGEIRMCAFAGGRALYAVFARPR